MMVKIIVLLLFLCTWTLSEAREEGNLTNVVHAKKQNLEFRVEGAKVLQLVDWFRKSSQNENTFVGRCLGAARRLKMVMPFIIFKLGVIVTTLTFIAIFTMKGLGIGVLLLLMNAAGLGGKLALLKGGGGQHYQPHYIPHHQPAVHVHVHKDHQHPWHHHKYDDGPTAFADRISDSLRKTRTVGERLELMELYKRLGFDVDGAVKSISLSH